MRIVSILSMIVVLTGCKAVMNPSPMPSSYTYHNRVYSAPDGPEAKDLGYEYSAEKNREILMAWNSIVNDLVFGLKNQLGLEPQAVYLNYDELPTNAFNTTYDQTLRAALNDQGYIVSTNPRTGTHIYYEAFRPGDENHRIHNVYYNDMIVEAEPYPVQDPAEFVFRLNVAEKGVPAGRVQLQRTLPAYGYETRSGVLSTTRGFFDLNK